jgi:hypothetical protein
MTTDKAAKTDGLVYLATPYSHPDPAVRERRYREVTRVAAEMMRRGDLVFSPITHSHPIALEGGMPTDWQYWQAFDAAVLGACRKLAVLMQPGWIKSAGVAAEIRLAGKMGIPVEHLPIIYDDDGSVIEDWTDRAGPALPPEARP